MRGAQRFLFAVFAIVAMVGLAILAAVLVPDYPNFAFCCTALAVLVIVVKLQARLNHRALEKRIAPVLAVLKKVGPMASREKDYQRVLVDHFFTDLSPGLKPESPLPSGTRVDAWIDFDGDDWYITVKRGLENQQRLILQGEIEDILLHSPKRGKDLWIVVILGLPDDARPLVLGQLNSLIDYTVSRSVEAGRVRGNRGVHIEVIPVELFS